MTDTNRVAFLGSVYFAQGKGYVQKQLYCPCGGELHGIREMSVWQVVGGKPTVQSSLTCDDCESVLLGKEAELLQFAMVEDLI